MAQQAQTKWTLLGSSPSLEGVQRLVHEFYGSLYVLEPEGDRWVPVRTSDRRRSGGTRVILKKGRYRFEMKPYERNERAA